MLWRNYVKNRKIWDAKNCNSRATAETLWVNSTEKLWPTQRFTSGFCIYLMKYNFHECDMREGKGRRFYFKISWKKSSEIFILRISTLCCCSPLKAVTMLKDRITSRGIKSSWSIYLLWFYARIVLCSLCWSIRIHFHFYSLWIHLEWAFYGSQHSFTSWVIKNESEGMFFYEMSFRFVRSTVRCSLVDWKGGTKLCKEMDSLVICRVFTSKFKRGAVVHKKWKWIEINLLRLKKIVLGQWKLTLSNTKEHKLKPTCCNLLKLTSETKHFPYV